jgi:hypothetical protein
MLDLSGRKLTFSEEFNRGDVLNPDGKLWSTTFGGGLRYLPSLGDKQIYLDDGSTKLVNGNTINIDPIRIENGAAVITANKTPSHLVDDIGCFQYTSGMINTGGGAFETKYGYVEIRVSCRRQRALADLLHGPPDGAAKGEIDILEAPGNMPHWLHQTVHTPDGDQKVVRQNLPQTCKAAGTRSGWTGTRARSPSTATAWPTARWRHRNGQRPPCT